MKKHHELVSAVLWAAAILAAALLKAPGFFSIVLLPTLAVLSLFPAKQGACHHRSDIS